MARKPVPNASIRHSNEFGVPARSNLRLLCLCVALAGCGSVSQEAARIESGLIGLRALTLRTCLGDAPYFEVREDGSEVWGYSDRTPESGANIEVSRAVGQGTAFQRPRVESGSTQVSDEPLTGLAAIDLAEAGRGQCIFLFGIENGQVRSFESRGRSMSGLNANAVCTMLLDRCIPAPTPAPDGAP